MRFSRSIFLPRPAGPLPGALVRVTLAVLVLLGAFGAPSASRAASLDFLNPPAGAEMHLELRKRFGFEDILDTSVDPPAPHPGIAPVSLEFFPDGSGDALLVQSTGMIAWLAPDFAIRGTFGVPSANSLANYRRTGEFRDNEGLLGLAFDPGFAQNRWFYVHTTPETRQGIQIWRLTWDPANLAGIWNSRFLVLDVPKPQIADEPIYLTNHDGGNPLFGPDGMLYVLTGDGGIGGTDESKNQAQSEASLWGKVLRVDPSGTKPPEIVARGARNPFTSTWFGDHLVIGDVGGDFADDWEEINLMPRPDLRTGPIPNFGWNVLRGPCWAVAGDPADCAGFTDPIHGYRKDDPLLDDDPYAAPGPPGTVYVTAVIVGPVYSGERYDGYLDDVLIYADFVQGWVRGALLSPDGRVLADRFLLHYGKLIPNLTRGPDGWVYLLGNDQGRMEIHRLVGPNVEPPPPPPEDGPPLVDHPTDPLPRWLSRTGFYPEFPNLTPLDRAEPFVPNFPLWSDGAGKERFLLLPEGTSVDTTDPEHWTFPVGTLFVKHFGYDLKGGGRREIETRVIQKLASGWVYGTYLWNAAQTEAELTDGKPITLTVENAQAAVPPSFTYAVPGTAQCRACHARQQDAVIGFEPVQLPRTVLRDLEARGVLGPAQRAAWPTVAGATWTEAAVRGYLHANCAHCHSEEGGLEQTLGFSLDHRETDGVIGWPSRRGRGTLVVPGDPANSLIVKMLAGAPDVPRMPPLGPQIVDVSAVGEVSEWIRWLGTQVPDAQHPAGRDLVELVELYQPQDDRYLLVTAAEASALETSLGPSGWRRTGYGMSAWARPATQIPGPRAVLRPSGGDGGVPSSFLGFRVVPTRSRTGPIRPGDRSDTLFYLYGPERGACASGFDPVYQVSVRRSGSPSLRYRYTTSGSVYRTMQQEGWTGNGVVMCAPR